MGLLHFLIILFVYSFIYFCSQGGRFQPHWPRAETISVVCVFCVGGYFNHKTLRGEEYPPRMSAALSYVE